MAFLAADLLPTPDQLQGLRLVANGSAPGDRILRGGRVLSVHTGEVLDRDVVIAGRHIAAVTPVGRFDAPEVIDVSGRFVTPSFIDAHIHIEYTMLPPGELARLIVPKGTTTLLADPNCIANVVGVRGMDFVGTTSAPMRIFQQISPEVPRLPGMELGGAVVGFDEVRDRVARPNATSLGEGNPFNLTLESATNQWHALAAGKRITGHTARLSGEPLWAYLAGGVGDDHNAVTTEEVLERLRLGTLITLMSGSMNDNCPSVLADLEALGPGLHHLCFCADDKHVEDLHDQGHIDHHVRQAVAAGVEPWMAIRMASLNAAIHFRLDHLLGSVTPSRLADLLVLDDLADPRPSMVFVAGELVAVDGAPTFTVDDEIPEWTRDTVRLAPTLGAANFSVAAPDPAASSVWVQAAEMYDGYFKRAFHAELPVMGGVVQCDTERDVLSIAITQQRRSASGSSAGSAFAAEQSPPRRTARTRTWSSWAPRLRRCCTPHA